MRQLQNAAAMAVSALLTLAAAAAGAGVPSREVSKTLPLAAGEHVRVETYKGSVKVAVWDRREVAVEARIVADDSCGSAERQARWVDRTKVEIERSAHGVSITSDYERLDESIFWFGTCTARPFVHYVIRMPKNAALRIKDYKSDLEVKDLEADLSIDTYKGNVAIAGLAGALKLETYKGDVKAGIVRLSGDVRGETYKGSIVLTLPSSAGFQVSADAGRHGDIRSDFEGAAAARGTRTGWKRSALHAEGAVNGGGPHVRLKTEKGSLVLRRG